ncbi:tetratricopeptide repeat protein [Lutibacter sp.]
MKKIILSILLLSSLVYANLFNDGLDAYNNGNYEKAVTLWEKAANQGDSNAQFNLGLIYENGYGVKQNYKEAMKWFRKAANQGVANAQTNLGFMYANGKGVRQDLYKAKKLFKKACDNGSQNGCTDYKILNKQGIQ